MPSAADPVRLKDLAAELGCDVEGDGEFLVRGVAGLETASGSELSFARDGLVDRLAATSAGALIVSHGIDVGGRPVIRSANPQLDFARAMRRLVPDSSLPAGISDGARVSPDAEVDASAAVAPGAVVGGGCRVGPRTTIHSNATLYPGVEVGADCVIHSGVVLREGTSLGDRVLLQPGVVIGGDGFGYVHAEDGRFERVPQVGRVVIEDDVEVGANSTVDRATLGETRIRRGTKIDNLVQVAHNCDVGEDVVIIAQSGLGGSTVVGRRAMIMAQAGSAGHLRIGERAFVGARAGLHRDVSDGARVWGTPQLEEHRWHRAVAALARLPGALRRLRAVERKLGLRPSRRGDEGGEPE
jgi:UDP-3-O-[3-hydroxymyristoyl] glucosamine N-acyltransferase